MKTFSKNDPEQFTANKSKEQFGLAMLVTIGLNISCIAVYFNTLLTLYGCSPYTIIDGEVRRVCTEGFSDHALISALPPVVICVIIAAFVGYKMSKSKRSILTIFAFTTLSLIIAILILVCASPFALA
jgi:hypothetical protein